LHRRRFDAEVDADSRVVSRIDSNGEDCAPRLDLGESIEPV
jgi:hypothetical protein